MLRKCKRRFFPFAIWFAWTASWVPAAGADVLTFVESHDGAANGLASLSQVIASPDGAYLYFLAQDAIAVYARDSMTGALTFVEAQRDGVGGVDGLGGLIDMAMSPDGAYLYGAGYDDNAIAILSRDALSGTLAFVAKLAGGPGSVADLLNPGMIAISPDGKHVYVSSFNKRLVLLFQRDSLTGMLSFARREFGDPGADTVILRLGFSPDGSRGYGLAYPAGLSDLNGFPRVYVFARDPSTGTLALGRTIRANKQRPGSFLTDPVDVAFSPDGSYVYFSSREDDAIDVFKPHAARADVNLVEIEVRLIDQPSRSFANIDVSPDGNRLYGLTDRDVLHVFSRSTATGLLTQDEAHDLGTAASDRGWVTVAPDGRSVYAVRKKANQIVVFQVGSCGDGTIDAGESCDDGAANDVGRCCSGACQILDGDNDGVCDRDDACPNVAGAAPQPLSVARLVLRYRASGPLGQDDKLSVVGAEMSIASAFDLSATDHLHLRVQKSGAPLAAVFAHDLANWERPSTAKFWRYHHSPFFDPIPQTRATLREIPAGSNRYRLAWNGKNANLESAPINPMSEDAIVTVEIETAGVGECFATTLATCSSQPTSDRCTP